MTKKLTKILVMGVLIIVCFGLFAGCTDQDVEFKQGTAWGDGSEKTITKIVGSIDEMSNVDGITIDTKYNADFFVENSLVIVAFSTRTGGSQIEQIKLSKNGSRLTVDISGNIGLMNMVDQVVVALEVAKESISGAKTIKFTTNLNKL